MDGDEGAKAARPVEASEVLLMDSRALLGILTRARQLLDWEGSAIVPKGPQQALIDYMARHRTAAGPEVLALLHLLRRLYGAGVAKVRRQVDRYARALRAFVDAYGDGPVALGRAPARINILGEHVDYVRYLPTEVLPFASREHDMLMLFRPTDAPRVRGRTTLAGEAPAAFDLAEGPALCAGGPEALEARWLDFLRRTGTPQRHWMNYAKAGVFFCRAKFPGVRRGFDFLLDSTIPAAGGASSSSTIVVLAGAATRIANNLPLTPEDVAADSSLAEWYIGTRGGTMDHATMCLAKRQHAVHIRFTPPSAGLVPLHRYRYRWITFFAHPADKGGDVLLQYNERSAVSRLVIPAMLERLLEEEGALRAEWQATVERLRRDRDDVEAAQGAQRILERLPEAITLGALREEFPGVYAEVERAYPRLAAEPPGRTLRVRARALHHAGEIVRVREAVAILREIFASGGPEEPEKTEPGLRAVGERITEAHESLRDLYELCTPDIDALVEILLSHPGVYGARLMGGGFGGNILALVSKEHVAELVDRAQERYYGPRGRDGVAEGAIMVSTPGEGFGLICLRDVLEQAAINASALWWKWNRYAPVMERCLEALLGLRHLDDFRPLRPVQPVIVAGGAPRARPQAPDDGYRSPPSLSVFEGRTALEHVLAALAALPFQTLPPAIVVNRRVRESGDLDRIRLPKGTRLVEQAQPLGTGHAVFCALGDIRPDADALVVWGSQPLIRPRTLARSVLAHQALRSSAMVFPTAVTRTPYAPIQRDLKGYVIASRETWAEGAPTRRLGETNVGAFVLGAATLHRVLSEVHAALWDAREGRYRTPSGLLGFPNEMARALVRQGRAVIALPIAHVRESLGLRDRAAYEEVKRALAEEGAL